MPHERLSKRGLFGAWGRSEEAVRAVPAAWCAPVGEDEEPELLEARVGDRRGATLAGALESAGLARLLPRCCRGPHFPIPRRRESHHGVIARIPLHGDDLPLLITAYEPVADLDLIARERELDAPAREPDTDCFLRGHSVSLPAPHGAMAWGEERQGGRRSYVGIRDETRHGRGVRQDEASFVRLARSSGFQVVVGRGIDRA